MNKKFITNLIILLSLNLLIKPFWILGIDLTVQNRVGASEYGLYFALMNFSFLFTMFLDLGITSFNNRNISQNNQLLSKHFSSIFLLRLVLAILYTIITFAIGWLIGYSSKHFYMLAFLSCNQFLLTMILYLRSNIASLQRFKTDSFISILDRVIMMVICSFLLWGHYTDGPFQIEWFVYAQTIGYLFTALIAFFIVIRRSSLKRFTWNTPFFIVIIKKSAPYALLTILMFLYSRIDSVLLERILPDGDVQAGIYASAYRLLDAANNLALLFTFLLLPMFARMLKHKDPVYGLAKLAYTILIVPGFIVAVGSYVYKTDLVNLLYPIHSFESITEFNTRLAQTADVFGLLMFSFLGVSTTYIFGTLLTANSNLRYLNIVSGVGVLINLILNLMLIPYFKAYGSAVATIVTQILTAAAQLIIAAIIFKFPLETKYLRNMGLFIAGLIGIAYLSVYITSNWMVNLCIMSALGFILAVALQLFNIKSLIALFSTSAVSK